MFLFPLFNQFLYHYIFVSARSMSVDGLKLANGKRMTQSRMTCYKHTNG